MLPAWQEIGPDLHFLPIEQPILTGLADKFGWPDAHLPSGYFPGAPELHTLDSVTSCSPPAPTSPRTSRTRPPGSSARSVRSWRPSTSTSRPRAAPVTYPLDPAATGTTPIPLHPGASRYYDALPGPEAGGEGRPTVPITELGHTGFWVEDLARMRDFLYRNDRPHRDRRGPGPRNRVSFRAPNLGTPRVRPTARPNSTAREQADSPGLLAGRLPRRPAIQPPFPRSWGAGPARDRARRRDRYLFLRP